MAELLRQRQAPPLRVLYIDHRTLGLHNYLLYDPLLEERRSAYEAGAEWAAQTAAVLTD